MPVYEYECGACGHQFEEWQKISDEPVRVCPKCRKKKVERLISQTAFHLKGGGWYSDLYASKKPGSSSGDKGGDKGGGSDGKAAAKDGGGSKESSSGSKKDGGGSKTASASA